MINSIKIINFRNFSKKEFFFSKDKNYIIGENGKGKTNTLEAISTITYNSIIGLGFEDLVKKGENLFFIEIDSNNNKIGLSFDLETKKKKYLINTKSVTKKKFRENIPKSVFFAPLSMNMFYLGPTLRREFLDNILLNSFDEYEKIQKNYKKIIASRNKVLKNICDKKSSIEEIKFWDEVFINEAVKIYDYRKKIVEYFEKNIDDLLPYFSGKINNISFKYTTKVDLLNIGNHIKSYLEKNIERDIILKRTSIGPHLDDFDIIIDDFSLSKFASRGETKSVVIGLKIMEINFIENITNIKPILLIDDLLSELDENHKNLLLKNIEGKQAIITTINTIDEENKIFI